MEDVPTNPDSGKVYRLIYRSRNCIPNADRRVELGQLFGAARSQNKKRHITGALLLLDDYFVQTLEGDEQAVTALLSKIKADPRHDSFEVLDTNLVATRVFARWAMAKVGDDSDSPDINLIAHADGISGGVAGRLDARAGRRTEGHAGRRARSPPRQRVVPRFTHGQAPHRRAVRGFVTV